MRKHENRTQSHQGRHTHCRTHKVSKNEEGAAERNEAAVQSKAVKHGAHSVFAHAEMNITAAAVGLRKVTGIFHHSFIRRPQVSAAAYQIRQLHDQFLQDITGSFTGSCFSNIFKDRFQIMQIYQRIAADTFFQFSAQFGINNFIISHQCFPGFLVILAIFDFIFEMLADGQRHIERLTNRPACFFFSQRQRFRAQRLTMAGSTVLLRAAITDMGTDNDQTWM